MNLFKFSEENATEELTDVQQTKKKLKRKSQRLENEPIFSGKVNLKLNDVENADEVWLIKVPKKIRMNRCEGQELILDEKTENIIELNNGQQLEAKIEKTKFKLPLMFPKNLDEDSINQRIEDGLKAEKAAKNGEDFEGKEESGENVAVSFKGSIVLSKYVDLAEVPKPEPEVIEKVPQPVLKQRHPFFGLEDPPTPVNLTKTTSSSTKKTKSLKRKNRE